MLHGSHQPGVGKLVLKLPLPGVGAIRCSRGLRSLVLVQMSLLAGLSLFSIYTQHI